MPAKAHHGPVSFARQARRDMQVAAIVVGSALLIVAACCIVFNWASIIVNARRRARRQQGRVSMIFLVPQVFIATAYLLVHRTEFFQHAGWNFLLAGVLDASVLALGWHALLHGAKVARAFFR